ncbi:MAG: hypothetical protein ACT4P2_04935 [Pseudomonadota bacterium]
MLTLKDCLSLCGLTEEEVLAIAEHERVPELVAAELGNYLMRRPDGVPVIRRMIVDDIAAAEARGKPQHAAKLKLVLKQFCDTHPEGAALQIKPVITPKTRQT